MRGGECLLSRYPVGIDVCVTGRGMRMTRAMFSVSGGRLWKSVYVAVFAGILLMSMSFSSYSVQYQRPKYMKYDPSLEHPYVYGNNESIGSTKEVIQWTFSIMTGDPEEFKKVFGYFNQFDGGLDINWISEDGFLSSYLTRATALKNWGIVPYLISKGIDVDHQDSHGITALIYASICGHLSTVGRLIIQGNADMTIKDSDRDDALSAARKGQSGEYSLCPEGTYEDVIDYLQTAMAIENPESIKANSPVDRYQKPVKYAAIAYKEGLPFLRAIVKDQPVSADFEAIQKCNLRVQRTGDTAGGEDCRIAAVFGSGQCGAYALSEDERQWGVGTGEDTGLAEEEALSMCNTKSNGVACDIDISYCQGE